LGGNIRQCFSNWFTASHFSASCKKVKYSSFKQVNLLKECISIVGVEKQPGQQMFSNGSMFKYIPTAHLSSFRWN
jgi:hypothetical protein